MSSFEEWKVFIMIGSAAGRFAIQGGGAWWRGGRLDAWGEVDCSECPHPLLGRKLVEPSPLFSELLFLRAQPSLPIQACSSRARLSSRSRCSAANARLKAPPPDDELLAGAKTEEEIVRPGGLLAQLTKRLVERAMEVDLTDHLRLRAPPGAARRYGQRAQRVDPEDALDRARPGADQHAPRSGREF
jgi:hypothetical protein